ncbi:MAG: hypothetical protein GY817_01220 [bacterium]|nr:hypothetical protein [bacterium]
MPNANQQIDKPYKYVPKVFHSSVDNSISSGQTETIINEDIVGQLDEIMIRVQDSDMDVILEIDGEEVYNFNLKKLKDDYGVKV